MSKNLYCPMIHGGLNITLKVDGNLKFNQCCLSTKELSVETPENLWHHDSLIKLREKNKKNIWDDGCWQCQKVESAQMNSFRTTQIEKFGIKENITGPQRIDLLFDRSCNLACLYCGPGSSTLWQKYNVDNNFSKTLKIHNKSTKNKIFEVLKNLNLENTEQIQFCGGETLLGNTYIDTARYITELIPHKAKTNFEIGFQTNGTQPWKDEYYELFEKFMLVKLIISMDCIDKRFEYSRWPASWNQVTDNILKIREKSPPNVMFVFQEVITNLSLFYFGENEKWIKENFKDNRVSDPTTHGVQLVMSKYLDVNNITNEYYESIKNTPMVNFLNSNFVENSASIKNFIDHVDMHDSIRNLNWKTAYPEVAEFYKRYL